MAFSGIKPINIQSGLQTSFLPLRRNLVICNFNVWKRRRLKIGKSLAICNGLGFLEEFRVLSLDALIKSPGEAFDNLFQNLLSQISSVNSLELFTPALGFFSGLAFYLIRRKMNPNSEFSQAGEWVLFMDPTPFNRFVLLRCPSISFEDSELLEDVSAKLLKENRHFVKLNNGSLPVGLSSGRIPAEALNGRVLGSGFFYDEATVDKLVYQRVCLHTGDGGVVSLDWPANLDLTKEHGLDTTMLLVPGTTEGSMDGDIRSFVCKSLKNGCFPIVMNPRGCAGSPLTTARLFTAADSDDISTAIQFICRSRPWTTLMGVGWGYGANMLTKYLSEVGERSPLTAAACINNPFDLEEATRSFPYHIAVDQKLTGGLKDILRANKELFLGRTKGFNVAEGLSATSVRDFEKAISIISYGFDTIEEFYSKSSTRQLVGLVKIPLLFIQSDDAAVPIFSIPRSSIAENRFTSLLMCSSLPSPTSTGMERSTLPWCHNFVLEWLSAVELGLLKGRHPLLKDVDITINPSKGLTLVGGREMDKKNLKKNEIQSTSDHARSYLSYNNENVDHFLNHTRSEVPNRFPMDSSRSRLGESDSRFTNGAITHLQSVRELQVQKSPEGGGLQEEINLDLSQNTSPADAEVPEGGGDFPGDTERSQVLQTAEVVMNMLDATMPNMLAEEQKKMVLSAVERGETLMKALEGAVPEEVRGKLSTVVSEIVQSQGTNLNLPGLMKLGWIPNVTSEVKSKIQEKFKGFSGEKGENRVFGAEGKCLEGDNIQGIEAVLHNDFSNPSSGVEMSNGTFSNQPDEGKHTIRSSAGSEFQTTLKLQEPVVSCPQLDSGHGSDMIISEVKNPNDAEQNRQKNDLSSDKTSLASQNVEIGLETADKQSHHDKTETAIGTQGFADEQLKQNHQKNDLSSDKISRASQNVEIGLETVDKQSHHDKTETAIGTQGFSDEQLKQNQNTGETGKHSVNDWALLKEVGDINKNAEKNMQVTTDENKPSSSLKPEEPSQCVSQSPEAQMMEKETSENPRNEEKDVQATTDQNSQSSSKKGEELSPSISTSTEPPSISVSQALDALTGFDDSTQMAVNSVFGVIENMIEQLEKDNQQQNDQKQEKYEDQESGTAIASVHLDSTDEHKPELTENDKNGLAPNSDGLQSGYYSVDNYSRIQLEERAKLQGGVGKKLGKEKLCYDQGYLLRDIIRSQGNSGLGDKIEEANGINPGTVDREKGNKMKGQIDYVGFPQNPNQFTHGYNFPLNITINPYGVSPYNHYVSTLCNPSTNPSRRSLDLDSTTDLFLEYFPEEGQWKLLDRLENSGNSVQDKHACEGLNGRGPQIYSPSEDSDMDKIIEPSYVILDTELQTHSTEKHEKMNYLDKKALTNAQVEDLTCLVKDIVLDDLKLEIIRRMGIPDIEALESNLLDELEQVAESVSLAAKVYISGSERTYGTLRGEHIVNAISSAVRDAPHLSRVVPVGVLVGSSLAALRKYFYVDTLLVENTGEQISDKDGHKEENGYVELGHKRLVCKKDQPADCESSLSRSNETHKARILNNDSVVVGAVTAALGATAILAHRKTKEHQGHGNTENGEAAIQSVYLNEARNPQKVYDRLEEAEEESTRSDIVSSLAEKAMSVAGPVVPTKSGGEVDHERLVAILADLGQKGGILRLIGKAALLWGGIRGAMSLTDKLISFLHIAERPLLQRLLGFVCMVLVLWSPIVIPLLPALMQRWTVKTSAGIAEYACIVGLYVAIMILVMIWGKRIRGYENPLKQYGLEPTLSKKFHEFLKGLIAGLTLIILIHSINALLGYARFTLPSPLPSAQPASAIMWFKMYGRMVILNAQGIVTAMGVATVEELLFRSWLPEEIALDIGFHRAIIISGLTFSLLQRYLPSVPGLWLLSLVLSWVKQRGGGDLYVPIGIRVGLLAANFILQTGSFLTYRPDAPYWVTGASPWNPFGGAVGLGSVLILALLLYPGRPVQSGKFQDLFADNAAMHALDFPAFSGK